MKGIIFNKDDESTKETYKKTKLKGPFDRCFFNSDNR